MNKKGKNNKQFVVIVAIILAIVIGLYGYLSIFGKSLSLGIAEKADFTIATGSTTTEILQNLETEYAHSYSLGFQLTAKLLSLDSHINPGLYELTEGMSNFDLVRLFRSGKRKTVRLTIKFARHYEDVLSLVAEKLEATYDDLLELTNNRQYMDSIGFDKANTICLFLPDTYEFYWNTSAHQFLDRMAKEYRTFWNESRVQKATRIDLTPQEVMTMASIIDQETQHNDEKPKIAGVYMNRLKGSATAGKLQADPTIKFALNDFEIKRVRKGHIERAQTSPYSTYEYAGLPPGPICTPSKAGIEAVLNYEHHNFYYFCAQPNYSGYSNFSATFSQHLNYAREYQRWLTQEGY